MSAVAIGCRVHSGWAALVAVARSSAGLKLIDRWRIEIADPKIAGSRQPFHAAEPMPFNDGSAFIDLCTKSTNRLAINALRGVFKDLKKQGHDGVACGVVLGSSRPLPELASILKSHALIHTAEGAFFRQAILHAAEACGLLVTGTKERALLELCAAESALLLALGRAAGPPWTQDQKLATLAARIAQARLTSA